MKVLKVPLSGEFENLITDAETWPKAFEGFEGTPSGQIAEFFAVDSIGESDLADLVEERPAILEYSEGLCRAEAEALARVQVYGAAEGDDEEAPEREETPAAEGGEGDAQRRRWTWRHEARR